MAAPDKPGHRLAYWLGLVAREVREDHGASVEDVASYVGVSGKTITNFEKGSTRLQEQEGIVAGIAAMFDVSDPRDIYADALRRWYSEGEPPEAKRGRSSGGAAAA